MFVRRARVREAHHPESWRSWPFSVPCVRDVAENGVTFTKPVTMLVGENGSGKSTLVEAIAEGFGLDSHGGKAGRKYASSRPKTPLGEVLELETTSAGAKMRAGSRTGKRGFFLRAETAFEMIRNLAGAPGYWDADTVRMSHGEGFLAVFHQMLGARGFYVLDEPEAGLSFSACLRLVALLHEIGESGAQVICATHSPILAGVPGADVLEVGEHGLRRTTWSDLDQVDHWARYLANPDAYLCHIVDR
ncbi:AAA family ATPase [Saccharopolyspora gloriosae]|uniref:Putative ATPase n=1 Tax=Saccharopolyspora gloriosae TaxID=455344 RepID=A0A840NP11_9PSEU|nr:putative ATPase [Saccharopolyspora gloriosae]